MKDVTTLKREYLKILWNLIITLLFLVVIVFGVSAKHPLYGKGENSPNNDKDWMERIDKIHETGYNDWLTVAWATMLLKQDGIIPKQDAPKVARVLLELLERPTYERLDGWTYIWGIDDYFMKELGDEVGGKLTLQRTTPPGRQTTYIRHHLLKRMCQIYDMQLAILELADKHTTTIMPGYTHEMHSQPTTFGHYLLSVFDAVQRSTKTLDLGYQMMNLNEMGVGSNAGTSWTVDRNLVSEYLGMDGLIENSNDAVSYTDGYLVVVAGLTNITNVLSRFASEIAYWSTTEYGFIVSGAEGKSFFMPQKTNNPNTMELLRFDASQMVGQLTNITTAGLKIPQGDTQDMLRMEIPTKGALDLAEQCIELMEREINSLQTGKGFINKERMLETTRESYIASTELANQIVRDHHIGYRTAHNLVQKFVVASREKNIPPYEASAQLLNSIAEENLGKSLEMTDTKLRELLDPEHFIKVTDSQGGVAPTEVKRMIDNRRVELEQFRLTQLQRIEKLENAQKKLVSDLESLIKQ